MAVADGVNVGYDVFIIDTKVTQQGATLVRHEACVNINTYKDERALRPNLPFGLKYT